MIRTRDTAIDKAPPVHLRALEILLPHSAAAREFITGLLQKVRGEQEIQAIVLEGATVVEVALSVPSLLSRVSLLIKACFVELNKQLPKDRITELDPNHSSFADIEFDLPSTLRHCERYDSAALTEQLGELTRCLFPMNVMLVPECAMPKTKEQEQAELDDSSAPILGTSKQVKKGMVSNKTKPRK